MTLKLNLRHILSLVLAVLLWLPVSATRYQHGDFVYDCNWSWGQLTATLLRYTGSQADVTVPETVDFDGNTYPVIYIGDEFSCPFADNDIIEVVRLPKTALSIGVEAFNHCTRLHTVDLGKNLQRIGAYAFSECPKLQQVIVHDMLTDIDDYAFAQCTAMLHLTLGRRVQNLGEGMLDKCGLQSLTLLNPIPATCHGRLSSNNLLYQRCELVVRIGTASTYQGAGGEWTRFLTMVERAETGDINADGTIDISDINILVNMMLSRQEADIDIADIDLNGTIDIADVNALINIMLGNN